MNPYYRWSMEEYEPMLQAICKEAHCWETAAFSGPEDLSTVLQSSIRDQLAHLRKLTIEISYSDRNDPVEIFKDAPVLYTISFNRDLWMHPVTFSLPWAQLRRYGGCSEWDKHLSALYRSPGLVDCCLQIDDIGPPSSIVQDPVALPNLRRLSISNPHFLKYLQTPALEELYCDYDVLPGPLFPPPGELQIAEVVTRLALFFPLPTELVCDFYSQSSTMAPALEHLSCFLKVDSEVGHEIQDEFVKAIESQWTRGSLKSVKIYGENLQIVSDRLDLLRTQGMECAVFGGEPFPSPKDLDDIPPELQILSVQ
ncbi:hypothetical protein MSAN_00372800 [Mycena sanguinolenta]|uniref:Uncharacterized protein n=1 Tax=Mycena sanguinolenta TaxID=230812 RepID=A0A8H6Z988_9AGAR|nr:hypothetical protein MSAN_00372800 [Mycena sanguinolenta]